MRGVTKTLKQAKVTLGCRHLTPLGFSSCSPQALQLWWAPQPQATIWKTSGNNLKSSSQQDLCSPVLAAPEIQGTAPVTAPGTATPGHSWLPSHPLCEPTYSSKPRPWQFPKCHPERNHDKILHSSPENPTLKTLKHLVKSLNSSLKKAHETYGALYLLSQPRVQYSTFYSRHSTHEKMSIHIYKQHMYNLYSYIHVICKNNTIVKTSSWRNAWKNTMT